jgi:hypothetical protein
MQEIPRRIKLPSRNSTNTVSGSDRRLAVQVFFAGGHGAVFDVPNFELLMKIAAQVYEA